MLRVRLLALFLLLAGAATSVVAVTSAQAAVIDNPVISITVTPANPRVIDPVRTDVVWCVPDVTAAGDTFAIALPPELRQLPNGFPLRDPNGELVATASITGQPAVATFTFTAYVDTHDNVCGTAFFESRLDSTLVPGQSYTLTYIVNGTTTFNPVITIAPWTNPQGRNTATKGAFFSDTTDECRTVADSCIAWYVESRLGPFQSITVSDDGLADAAFVCSTLTVTLWSVDASGNLAQAFSPASQGTTVQTTCTPTSLQVVATNVPAARLVRVVIRATPTTLNPDGGVLFANTATVTQVSEVGSTQDTVNGQRRSVRVGGDANGVIPPPPTTTSTTIVASQAPAPTTTIGTANGPVLPATGSNPALVYVAASLVLAGAALLIAGTRRPNGAWRAVSGRRAPL
ncbi:MAG TPA: Ig-like domain-containing protein [Ilumatobacteraceae bacterium]